MSDKFDPDEKFKLDMEPEEAIRKFLDGDPEDGSDEDESQDESQDDPEDEDA